MSLRMLLSAVSSETGQQGPFMRREGYWMSCVESAQEEQLLARKHVFVYRKRPFEKHRSVVCQDGDFQRMRLETFFTAPGTSVA